MRSRTATIVTVAISLLIAAAWLAAPLWLASLVEEALTDRGISVHAIEIESVDLDEIRLARLHISNPDSGIEASVTSATVGYTLPGLMQGEPERLRIGRLTLKIVPKGRQADAGFALVTPAALLAASPLQWIDIGQIDLQRLDSEGKPLQQLRGQAGFKEGVVSILLAEPTTKQSPLQARLVMNRQGAVQGTLRRADSDIVRIDSLVNESSGRITIEGGAHAVLTALDRELREWIELPDLHFSGSLDGSWQLSLPAGQAIDSAMLKRELKATASLELDAGAITSRGSHALRLQGDIAYAQGSGQWRIEDASRLVVASGARLNPLSLGGAFAPSEVGWQLTLNQGASLHASELQLDKVRLQQPGITLLSPLSLQITQDQPIMIDAPAAVELALPLIRSGNQRLRSRAIGLHLDAGRLTSPSGRFSVQDLDANLDGITLPKGKLDGRFDLTANPISASGHLGSNNGAIRIDWRLSHRLEDGRGSMHYSLRPLQLGPDGFEVATVMAENDSFGIQQGKVSGSGSAFWGSAWQNRLDLQLSSLHGFYMSNDFSNLNCSLKVSMDRSAIKLSTKRLSIAKINSGIPIHAIGFDANATYPFKGSAKIMIDDLGAEALGGHIRSERIGIDLSRPHNRFLVTLDGLDAKQIAEIQAQEGLYADGTLDGTLPFDWRKDGLHLSKGVLQARNPGGIIRYLGNASVRSLAASDQMTKMALDILSDLHYWQLKLGIDADQDGQMKLQIALKGKNPGYENGRPVEFNFNIEQNVLKLLYSLRMADEISERMQKRMQKRLQQP